MPSKTPSPYRRPWSNTETTALPRSYHVPSIHTMEVAQSLGKGCAALAGGFRGPGAFARGDQLVRASLSIASNISEGCGRGSIPDFRRFLLHARGSAQETLTQLRLIEPQSEQQ